MRKSKRLARAWGSAPSGYCRVEFRGLRFRKVGRESVEGRLAMVVAVAAAAKVARRTHATPEAQHLGCLEVGQEMTANLAPNQHSQSSLAQTQPGPLRQRRSSTSSTRGRVVTLFGRLESRFGQRPGRQPCDRVEEVFAGVCLGARWLSSTWPKWLRCSRPLTRASREDHERNQSSAAGRAHPRTGSRLPVRRVLER